jgi:hypothetical protein
MKKVRDHGKTIDQELKRINTQFLKVKVKDKVRLGSFFYRYFAPDPARLTEMENFLTYQLMRSQAINSEEFPSEEKFKEIFKKQKEILLKEAGWSEGDFDDFAHGVTHKELKKSLKKE